MNDQGYDIFEHGADIGVRGRGSSLEEAFANGAKALFSILATDMDALSRDLPVSIAAVSYDLEGLFVAWLNALLAEADLRRMLFCSFEVNIVDLNVVGTAWGEVLQDDPADRGIEVKGATFTELKVEQTADGLWIAQCVVDV